MKEIEIFYLTGCPYCGYARRAADELMAEDARYAAVPLRWIEEREHRALADSRDYYYVPTVYCGGEKLYECSPRHDYETVKNSLRAAFDTALGV